MIVIERPRLLPSAFYLSPWMQSASPVACASRFEARVPRWGPSGSWQMRRFLYVGEFWAARDDSGVSEEERGEEGKSASGAGVCPPGGAGVDGFVMKKQAGVRPGSALVAD